MASDPSGPERVQPPRENPATEGGPQAEPADGARADGPTCADEPETEEVVAPAGQPAAEEAQPDLERRLRQVSSAYVALQQEMQGFRERTERLQEERDRRRRGEVVMTMFEPVQNLRRSLEAWKRHDMPGEAVQGLTLVLDQFQEALRKLGLEEISAAPVPFDPNVHDAICTVPVPLAALDGYVVQVFEAGYRVGSQIIQPARVLIGRYTEPTPEPTPEPTDEERGATEPGADDA